ncbi:hypothetical protein B0H12DRAFT_1239582 [Mycena haematopus]|nr:hypothetical protein B0H12DRAFT_1239582 [Mycena haematopus]
MGRCGSGVFTEPWRANEQTNGFSGFVQRSCKRWEGPDGVDDVWAQLCRQHHGSGCPPQTLPDGFITPTHIVRPTSATVQTAIAPPGPSVAASAASLLPPARLPKPFGASSREPCRHSVPSALRPPTFTSPSSSTSTLTNLSDLFSPGGVTSPSVRPSTSASVGASTSASGSVRTAPLARAAPLVPSVRAMHTAPAVSADDDGITVRDEWSDDEEGDENEIHRVYWAVLGMARRVFSTAAVAVAAAERRGLGSRFTLLSSTDVVDLETSQDIAASSDV